MEGVYILVARNGVRVCRSLGLWYSSAGFGLIGDSIPA